MHLPKAFLFDVFGTVVDWRSSVAAELAEYFLRQELSADAEQLALDWRAMYDPAMAPIREGRRPYTKLDVLHRENLSAVFEQYDLPLPDEKDADHLTRIWHRLSPWPDSIAGLTRLKTAAPIGALSNGNVALMVNLARHSGLPWDVILGADWAKDYKPAPAVYLTAADALGLAPQECMMVAAHNSDLEAAQTLGLQTAFIHRPTEYGPGQTKDLGPEQSWTFVAKDLEDLATQFAL